MSPRQALAVVATAGLLLACSDGPQDRSAGPAGADGRARALAVSGPAADVPASPAEARRFLSFASFGANDAAVEELTALGYSAWIDKQFARPPTSHRAIWEGIDAAIRLQDPQDSAGTNGVLDAFWTQALNSPDQLRLRVAYALSQIFVVSAVDAEVTNQPRALAAWLDMLGTDGLTTYRQLLEAVARHPLMGRYLTHLRNRKADLATGRVPDENFGREVMQLFSIGVVRLNPDGSPLLVDGQPAETYGPSDVTQISRVFTGWSFACPAFPSNSCFNDGAGSSGASDPDREFKPMLGYPQFHSPEAKEFLGVGIPAQNPANPGLSLQVALDTLAAHPNVGPFIGRQLIQRLVMSNPSPAYIADISAVWADNGAGVRGDMKAVVKAILLHPEARRPRPTPKAGKLREPVLRLAAFLRAFPHTSISGRWQIGDTDLPADQLGQTPLRAPSVFNFYRPGYVAPGSQSAAAGMVAPELQLLNESTVAGFANFMVDGLIRGFGTEVPSAREDPPVLKPDLQRDWSAEVALADRPAALAAHVFERAARRRPRPRLRHRGAGRDRIHAHTRAPARQRQRRGGALCPPQPRLDSGAADAGCARVPGPALKSREATMPILHDVSRRQFLRQAGTYGALLGGAAPLALNLSALGSAAAAPADDYRAIVCVFLFGGNDAYNTVLAVTRSAYGAYRSVRSQAPEPIALLPPGTAPDATAAPGTPAHLGGVLPVAAQTGGRVQAHALHPLLGAVQHLYAVQRRLAILPNIGPLVMPTSKAEFANPLHPRPARLFSHNDQQNTWQALAPEGATRGWGGRLADQIIDGNSQPVFTAISAAGNAVWLAGDRALPYQVGIQGAVRLGVDANGRLFDSAVAGASLHRLASQARSNHPLALDLAAVGGRSVAAEQSLRTALRPASDPLFGTPPAGGSYQPPGRPEAALCRPPDRGDGLQPPGGATAGGGAAHRRRADAGHRRTPAGVLRQPGWLRHA